MLKIKRKRYAELLDGAEKKVAEEEEEEAFQARMREIGYVDPNGSSRETGEGLMELQRLHEEQHDPELAMIDALVLSEVAARSSQDITALAR